jgi:hypothetical protein
MNKVRDDAELRVIRCKITQEDTRCCNHQIESLYHDILGLFGEDATPTRLSGAGVLDQPGDLADGNGLSLQPS